LSLSSASGTPERALDQIAQARVVTTVDPRQAWEDVEAHAPDAPGRVPKFRTSARYRHGARVPDTGSMRDAWIFQLAVLASLDRLLQDASRGGDIAANGRGVQAPMDPGDALLASIHASFNAAYVYPQLSTHHEMFTAGAWLGYLVRGRTALMPVFVAQYIAGQSDRRTADEDTDVDRCDLLLRFHADLAVGWERLLKVARRVERQGVPVKVAPRRPSASEFDASRYELTRLISANILQRLNQYNLQS
jgi:hypothetical protein